jgi:hypothetical protein
MMTLTAGRSRTYPSGEPPTVHAAGHLHVAEHHVHLKARPERGDRIEHAIAALAQIAGNARANDPLVLDNQNGGSNVTV